MVSEDLESLAAQFVREISRVEVAQSDPEFSIGLIVAHSAIPVAGTLPAVGTIRYGICVSMGALIGHGLLAHPSAMLIEQAFRFVRGRALHFLKFRDAAVLDWCWRNCSYDTISQELVYSNLEQIRNDYGFGAEFDERLLSGSIDALERNAAIVPKPNSTWRLVEEVKVFA